MFRVAWFRASGYRVWGFGGVWWVLGSFLFFFGEGGGGGVGIFGGFAGVLGGFWGFGIECLGGPRLVLGFRPKRSYFGG